MSKSFEAVESVEELNRVNDEQKAIFAAMVAADPSLIEKRHAAYLRRWSEALPYVQPGDRVLDIGAGWPVPRVADAVFSQGVNYHVVDIDEDQVDAWATELQKRGQDPSGAKHSPNTVLPFSDSSMDFIFSSHCLEHSPDLHATFSEMKRVLRPHGLIDFSVPFGFDSSDEHLLFLGIEQWLRACELAGFRVKGWTVGNTYADGWDLSILASAEEGFNGQELGALNSAYQKVGRHFISHDDPDFQYGDAEVQPPFTICRNFTLSRKADYLLLLSHQWSGILRLTDSSGIVRTWDLFERADHIKALPLDGLSIPMSGTVAGMNPASRADQIVVYGALC